MWYCKILCNITSNVWMKESVCVIHPRSSIYLWLAEFRDPLTENRERRHTSTNHHLPATVSLFPHHHHNQQEFGRRRKDDAHVDLFLTRMVVIMANISPVYDCVTCTYSLGCPLENPHSQLHSNEYDLQVPNSHEHGIRTLLTTY